MSDPFRLPRTKQCAKCPWKVTTDPYDIPHGYDPEAHAALRSTIADPADPLASLTAATLRMMACHEHPDGKEVPCVGWLINQLGPGNNIGLRLRMRRCENIEDVELDGEQHDRFEDTLPRGQRGVST